MLYILLLSETIRLPIENMTMEQDMLNVNKPFCIDVLQLQVKKVRNKKTFKFFWMDAIYEEMVQKWDTIDFSTNDPC